MKFRVSVTQPGALAYDVACAVQDHRIEIRKELTDECYAFAEAFMQYGECLTVEFDTEAKTATVVPHGD
jgi:aminoglycoside/choline kinase family phosphotransferase